MMLIHNANFNSLLLRCIHRQNHILASQRLLCFASTTSSCRGSIHINKKQQQQQRQCYRQKTFPTQQRSISTSNRNLMFRHQLHTPISYDTTTTTTTTPIDLFHYHTTATSTMRHFSTVQQQQAQRLFLCINGSSSSSSSDNNDDDRSELIAATTNSGAENGNNDSDIQMIVSTLKQNIILPSTVVQQYSSLLLQQPKSSSSSSSTIKVVHSVDEIVHAVNEHYSTDNHLENQQFVGGMGEQDLGVYFVPYIQKKKLLSNDPNSSNNCTYQYDYTDVLQCKHTIQMIQEGITAVKEMRHGVPFGCYTNGLVYDTPPLNEMDIDIYEVSLFGSNPTHYSTNRKYTIENANNSKRDFQQVCSFIITAIEEYQVKVEVSVINDPNTINETRSFALSLGAQQVHVYNEDNSI